MDIFLFLAYAVNIQKYICLGYVGVILNSYSFVKWLSKG